MITKQKVLDFRADFMKAIKPLEEKYGIKLETKSTGYTDMDFHFRVICTELSENGEKKVDMQYFNTLKSWLGFEGSIGDAYVHNGITYTVAGLDSKKHKFPVIIKGSDGHSYKSSIETANAMLKHYKAN